MHRRTAAPEDRILPRQEDGGRGYQSPHRGNEMALILPREMEVFAVGFGSNLGVEGLISWAAEKIL